LEILRQVDVEPDSEVEISVEDSAIVIRPRRRTDDDARAAARNVIRNRGRLLERLSK
jgi:antitoxin component of MazEF toxin-antitoxin module